MLARTLAELRAEDRIVLRYVDNPNGSIDDIAGICNGGPQRGGSDAASRAGHARAAGLGRRRGAAASMLVAAERTRRRLIAGRVSARPRNESALDAGLGERVGADAELAPRRVVDALGGRVRGADLTNSFSRPERSIWLFSVVELPSRSDCSWRSRSSWSGIGVGELSGDLRDGC